MGKTKYTKATNPYKSSLKKLGGVDKRKRLTDEEITDIKTLFMQGSTRIKLALQFGVTYQAISYHCNLGVKERQLQVVREKGGYSSLYYDKEKNTKLHKNYRERKRRLAKEILDK